MAASDDYSNAAGGSDYHVPVLFHEAIDALNITPGGVYVDCTFGGGGHTRGILARLGPQGRLVAFDQDADAATNLPPDKRILFVPENFRHMQRFLRFHGIEQVDGVLADLGVSSHQFNQADRGFAHRFDANLDMRMDQRQARQAADVLNGYSASQLQQVFSTLGEVSNSKTLAQAIVSQRAATPFTSVAQLNALLAQLSRGNPHRYRSQVYQALRMEVNEELIVLEEWLRQVPLVLKKGGRVAVITFHSLEDRLVKNFFRHGSNENKETDVVFGTKEEAPLQPVNKKPIEPTTAEIKQNERARSARLRIAERR